MNIDELKRVNDRCNALPYKSEPFEDWSELDPVEGGDCDSYAVSKLVELVSLGWPIGDLRLATCMTERATVENHAVLVVAFEGQEYVLDNRQNGLCSISDLDAVGYTPVRIQREGGSKGWKEWLWAK